MANSDSLEPVEPLLPEGPILVPHDFTIETFDAPGAKEQDLPAPVPAPVVVVQGRSSWWSPFVAPALLIAVAILLAAYRPWANSGISRRVLWERKPTEASSPAPTAGSDTPSSPVVVKVETVPLVPKPLSLPEPSPNLAAAGLSVPEPEHVRPAVSPGARPELLLEASGHPSASAPHGPALPAHPQPKAQPSENETTRALEAIRAEADKQHERKIEEAAIRSDVARLEQERLERLSKLQREQVESARPAFRAEVHRLLEDLGNRAGPQIWQIMERTHVEPSPGVEAAIAADLKRRGSKLDRNHRIALFRSHGLPEPIILAELVRDQMKQMSARNGPRSREDAIVRAARQLLAVPLGPSEVGWNAPTPSSHHDLQ